MSDITRESIVSLDVVAGRFDVTVQTVRNWGARRISPLETYKAGGKVVTSWEAVQRFLRRKDGGSSGAAVRGGKPPKSPNASARKYLKEIGL